MESTPPFIVLPKENYVVRSQVLQQLPTYHGMESENPYTHIRDFQVLCRTSNEMVWLTLFPFTLEDKANTWLENLTPLSMSIG